MDNNKTIAANFSIVAGGQDTEAIAVWAYPDSNTVSGTIYVGAVAYHSTGIDRIDFDIGGGSITGVFSETINPETNEYEYVFSVDTTQLTDDVSHTIHAIAYPNSGVSHTLPDLIIQVDNTPDYNIWYVDDDCGAVRDGSSENPYCTIHNALIAANSGDSVTVRDGSYSFPDGGYGFDKYVAIVAENDAGVEIVGSGVLNSNFLKFIGIIFRFDFCGTGIRAQANYGHLWVKNSKVIGPAGPTDPNVEGHCGCGNTNGIWFTAGGFLTVENSEFYNLDAGINYNIVDGGRLIVRANYMHDLIDAFKYESSNLLFTGNIIEKVISYDCPPYGSDTGEDPHTDFFDSSAYGGNVVIRNNKGYNSMSQGIKMGGFSDSQGIAERYKNIAIVNNVIANGLAVNLRIGNNTLPVSYWDNILIEYNTIWKPIEGLLVKTVFFPSNLPTISGVVFKGNILGEYVGGWPDTGYIHENNCYYQDAGAGSLNEGSAVIGNPNFIDSGQFNFNL